MAEQEKDLADWMASVEERLRGLFTMAGSRPPLNRIDGDLTVGGSITIEDLGRLLLEGGGSVLVNDGQGRALFYAGGFQETVPGTPQGYGVALYRLDGSVAMILADNAHDEQAQRLKFYDSNGKNLLTEDPTGDGAQWPGHPIPFAPSDYLSWPGTDSAGYANLQDTLDYRSACRAYMVVRHTTDVSDTAGELRMLVNGAQVGATVPVGFAIGETMLGPFDVPGEAGDAVGYAIQGRRTAGTGKVRGTVKYAWAGGFF